MNKSPRRPPGGLLSARKGSWPVKLLMAGVNGSGKTASLAALAKAGYNLRILDFDNGIDVLGNLLSEEESSRVRYRICTDKMKKIGQVMLPEGVPRAFTTAMKMLDKWEDGAGALGPITEWGLSEVLVVDSLTFAARAAMRLHLMMRGRIAERPWNSDYLDAQNMIEQMLQMLFTPYVKCNVIVLTHIVFVEHKWGEVSAVDEKTGKPTQTERSRVQAFPSAIGKALSPHLGSYFNTMLEATIKGQGVSAKRVLLTQPRGLLGGTKCSAPKSLPAELPQETGLATFFAAVQNQPEPEALLPVLASPEKEET